MSYIAIKQSTMNEIASWLGKKPYVEVHHLFRQIQDGVKPLEEAYNEVVRDKEKPAKQKAAGGTQKGKTTKKEKE